MLRRTAAVWVLANVGMVVGVMAVGMLAGCAGTPKADGPDGNAQAASAASEVGTWRLVEMREKAKGGKAGKVHRIDKPFYARFYADGRGATWPTPVAPISWGRYTYANGLFSLADAPEMKPVPMVVTEHEMWQDADAGRVIYRRVVPDLEPGVVE